jgi:hypothetical protein
MKRISRKAVLASAAFGAILGGCATTVEMGPGYYHYDTRAVHRSEYQSPAYYSYREPTASYSYSYR